MEYPDDNRIPISCFPFYARESEVKQKAPVRKSGAFLFFQFIILPQVQFLLSKGTKPGFSFSLKKFKKFFIFKTSGSFLSSRRCKGGEEHRMKSIYQLFESFMEQEQLDPVTANRLLKKILFMLRNKSKSDDPTRRNQK